MSTWNGQRMLTWRGQVVAKLLHALGGPKRHRLAAWARSSDKVPRRVRAERFDLEAASERAGELLRADLHRRWRAERERKRAKRRQASDARRRNRGVRS